MNRRRLITLAVAAAGAVAGWFYWRFVGCSTGSCAITSHPVNSSLYGALMGWLVADLVLPRTTKNSSPTN
ncbi:MAG: DUF6132 family protein [Flavobacteriales bacterium]